MEAYKLKISIKGRKPKITRTTAIRSDATFAVYGECRFQGQEGSVPTTEGA